MRRSSSAADPEPRVAALRTPVAIGAALALGLGVLLVPAAERAVAQGLPANPHLVVDPECGAPVDDVGGEVTLTLRLYNMPLGDQVTIVWDVTSEFRRFYDVAPDAYGFLETTLTVPQRDASPIQVDVQHTSDFDDVPDTIATAYFYAPCPSSITIDPVCDAPADPADPRREVTIDVVGSNFSAFGVPVTVTLEGPQGVVAGPVEVTVDRATRGFGTQIRSPALPVGEYRVVASQPRFDVTYVEFPVPCPAPEIRLTPACGDAGAPPDRYAILIDGSGFAENWAVEFYFGIEGGSWQRFLYGQDLPPPGALDDFLIEPLRRPDGSYAVIARQGGRFLEVMREARAAFEVPCPPVTPPTWSFDPACGAPQFVGDEQRTYEIAVSGAAFIPLLPVQVTFDALGTSAQAYSADVRADGTFELGIDPLARPAGTYQLRVSQSRGDVTLFTEDRPFSVPCLLPDASLTIDPACGRLAAGEPGAYSITATGSGFIPGFVELTFDPAGAAQELPPTFADPNGGFVQPVVLDGRPAGSYALRARQRDANGTLAEAEIALSVPCSDAILRVIPASGPPGLVVRVEGENFDPGDTLLLRWSAGIASATPIAVTVEADGTFSRQVLIFRGDFIGAREMSVELPADADAFPGVVASYLVVPGRGTPPAFVVEGSELPIVIRR